MYRNVSADRRAEKSKTRKQTKLRVKLQHTHILISRSYPFTVKLASAVIHLVQFRFASAVVNDTGDALTCY